MISKSIFLSYLEVFVYYIVLFYGVMFLNINVVDNIAITGVILAFSVAALHTWILSPTNKYPTKVKFGAELLSAVTVVVPIFLYIMFRNPAVLWEFLGMVILTMLMGGFIQGIVSKLLKIDFVDILKRSNV